MRQRWGGRIGQQPRSVVIAELSGILSELQVWFVLGVFEYFYSLNSIIMIDFPHAIKINGILNNIPNNCCGSASACIVFEKLGLPYDPLYFVKEGRDGISTPEYPVDGSNVFGCGLAMAKTALVNIDIYIDFDIDDEYNTLDDYEKKIVDEIKLLDNISVNRSISIEEILNKLNDDCIPILAFFRNGDASKSHFSPLRGLSGEVLILPLNDATGSCNCNKDEFVSTWWTENSLRSCVLVRRK